GSRTCIVGGTAAAWPRPGVCGHGDRLGRVSPTLIDRPDVGSFVGSCLNVCTAGYPPLFRTVAEQRKDGTALHTGVVVLIILVVLLVAVALISVYRLSMLRRG